jgi:hypothetical protein
MQLTRDIISACSSEGSLRRGEKYYQQGRVRNFKIDGNRCTAVVIGTDEYSVHLDLAALEGDCNCYAYDGDRWCKHMVAVGLVAAGGEIKAAEEPKVKRRPGAPPAREGLEKLLDESSEQNLRAALRLIVDRFPDAYRFVETALNPLELSDDKAIMAAVRQSLQPVKRARSWHAMVQAAIIAQEELGLIARDARAGEGTVRGLLAAAQYVYKQLEQIDDSDGTLQAACEALCDRAIAIVSEVPEYEALLYEALARPSELPLASYILTEADEHLRERFVTRLEKHLYKRDEELAGVSQDEARYLLGGYFARSGDKRLMDFLAEHKVHENFRLGLLLKYHEARGEWAKIIKLLWPEREEYGFHQLLRRVLAETGDHDKLIQLQVEDTLHANDVQKALLKLRHLLEQYGQADKLSEVIERLIKNPRLSLQQKAWLLTEQERYQEAADCLLDMLRLDTKNRARSPWANAPYAVVDAVVEQNRRLQTGDKAQAIRVWKELFTLEADRVLKANQYDRFTLFGDELIRLGQDASVRDIADVIAEGYPTRKKLVAICNGWRATSDTLHEHRKH